MSRSVLVTGGNRGIGLAIAHAFRDGRIGVMDYYNLKNLQADTDMRGAIAGTSGPKNDRPGETGFKG